jgi:pimeloyl-ACP methyl ester carboxylesterase
MKTPLLFLHGALGTAHQFNQLLPLFAADQPVFALTLPGHGADLATTPYSMSTFGQSVLDFMDAHNIARAHVFGYSMGGYVALHLAATHPERIRRVVTYGTKLDWSPETAAGMSRMFDPEKIAAKAPALASALAAVHHDWPAVCARTAAFLHDLGAGKGIADDVFTRIACPVVIGWGSADHVVSEAECNRVAHLLPHGRVEILFETKHGIEFVDSNILFKFVEAAIF